MSFSNDPGKDPADELDLDALENILRNASDSLSSAAEKAADGDVDGMADHLSTGTRSLHAALDELGLDQAE